MKITLCTKIGLQSTVNLLLTRPGHRSQKATNTYSPYIHSHFNHSDVSTVAILTNAFCVLKLLLHNHNGHLKNDVQTWRDIVTVDCILLLVFC